MRKGSPDTDSERVGKLLEAVFTICAMYPSIPNEELEALIERARKRARESVSRARGVKKRVDIDSLALAIHRWKRSPSYLSDEGVPAAIKARGPAPSIEALFREIRRGAYFQDGLKHLTRLRHIRRLSSGLYVPSNQSTIILQTLTPELFNILTKLMNRLMATVLYNTKGRRQKTARLIERTTYVPDLPRRLLPAFARFSREQGIALIETIDNWLESHRGPSKPRSRSKRGRVTAGLHVFSFFENP